MRKIIQIIPINHDLYAEYKQSDGNFTCRVIALQLVEEDETGETYRFIEGVGIGYDEISGVESSHNFLGYVTEPIIKKPEAASTAAISPASPPA